MVKRLVDMRPIRLMISYVLVLALVKGIELIMVEYGRRLQYTPVKRLIDNAPTPLPQRPATLVRYNRRVCSGLGDRIAVILNVAAFALSMNASCFVFWCEVNNRFFPPQLCVCVCLFLYNQCLLVGERRNV